MIPDFKRRKKAMNNELPKIFEIQQQNYYKLYVKMYIPLSSKSFLVQIRKRKGGENYGKKRSY